MKRILAYFVFSVVIAWVLSAFTCLCVPSGVLGTLYTVSGVIFSVGMSITIAPKTNGVSNVKMRGAIRASYLKVRNSFIYLFGIDTVLFIVAEGFEISQLPSFLDVFCALFSIVSVIYFIYNFIKLQELGEEIEDQVLKEKRDE